MPDINALFLQLVKSKSLLYVAGKLGHESTSRVERWVKQKEVPESFKFAVMNLLKEEGELV